MPTTVVLGVGIVGLASAHSLTKIAPPDHRVHLVEPAPDLFASASGKAAGFLAKDWFATATAPLGLLSFQLHRSLAEQHNGSARWGYSASISYSLDHSYQSDAGSEAPSDAIATQLEVDATIPQTSASPTGDADAPATVPLGSSDNPPSTNHSGEGGLDWLLNGTSRASVASADPMNVTNSAGGPRWLRAKPQALEMISDIKSTAQVHPRRLCEFLLEQCLAAGVTLHHPARASKLVRDEKDPARVTRLRIEYLGQASQSPDGRARVVDVLCDNIVIAAGCWTPQVYTTLFPNANRIPRISHLAGYSVTFKTKNWPPGPALSATDDEATVSQAAPQSTSSSVPGPTPAASNSHAIFTDATGFAPEIFSRTTGDIWLGGLNPPGTALPRLPTDAQMDAGEVERLLTVARALCGEDIELRGQALCFRPVSVTGRPIIARMHEADLGDGLKPTGLGGQGGVFIATGHGPWGISLSLGTGQVVAEMVLGRETSADVAALSRWDGVVDYSTRPLTP